MAGGLLRTPGVRGFTGLKGELERGDIEALKCRNWALRDRRASSLLMGVMEFPPGLTASVASAVSAANWLSGAGLRFLLADFTRCC